MKRFIFLFALVWLVLTSHSTFSQNQNVIKDKILSGNIKFKNLDKGELCTSNIYTIEWEGIPANDTVRIEYSTNGGVDWILITNSATGLKYDWSVPETPCLNCTARIITKDVDNPFQIISVNPNKGLVGDEITISGIGFGSSQGTSIVSFSGANATQYISWSDTQIKVKVPTGAVTGTVFITVNGKKSNEVAFAIEANPIILTSINPNSAKIGDAVTLTGNGFGSNRGSNYVSFNGTNATEYTNWSDTQIVCKVPNGAPSGQVTVTVDGSSSNGVMFTVESALPQITGVTPNSGYVDDQITIAGTNFGASQGSSVVSFNGTTATNLIIWDNTQIIAKVPTGATTGKLSLTVGGQKSNEMDFTVLLPPSISGLNPTSGYVDDNIVISGVNFGTTQSGSTVAFNGTNAINIVSWNATSITAKVPVGAISGNVTVSVNSHLSNGTNFTVIQPPSISGLNPTSAYVDDNVVISGANFGATQGTSTVSFNGTNVTNIVSWSATSITAKVPSGAISGNVVITVSGHASNGSNFTVLQPPSISGLNPTSAYVDDNVVITGANFGATQSGSTVAFNGTNVTEITNWSNTQITVEVPTGATTGNVIVTVSGHASNGSNFTVLQPPSISGLNPTSAYVDDNVVISGANFGATQNGSTVAFNGTNAGTIVSWGATSITAKVPVGATSGNVVVTVNGHASNGSNFTVLLPPAITNLNPTSGSVGSNVTITGTSFGSTQGTSIVAFNGTNATSIVSWNATQIVATVPTGATTGNVVVTVNGHASNGSNFTVNIQGVCIGGEVLIGTQIWSCTNLNVTTYRDGSTIPQVTDNTAWANLTTGAWCYYSNNSANGTIYGKLYNGFAVNDPRGLAPTGWHVPSDAEWTTLATYLGGIWEAGGKMKEIGTAHWMSPNTGATNESGFSALPGGWRSYDDGAFYAIGSNAYLWSSTESNATDGQYRVLFFNGAYIYWYSNNKANGFSVRLIKD